MKKPLAIILAVSLLTASLAACGNSAQTESGNSENAVVQNEKKDVTITLSKDFVGGDFHETLTDEQKALGFKTATKNEDGSVTYTMTKKAHESILAKFAPEIEKGLNELISDGTYASYKSIEHNADFTEITVNVDKTAYENSFDGLANYSIIMVVGMYQMLDGKTGDDIAMTLKLVDDATKTEFKTLKYPEDFETDTMTSTTQDTAAEKYTITIDSSRVAKNYEDKDCIVVDFTFTNNSDSNQSFGSAMMATAFQDGVQIDSTVGVYDGSADVTDSEYKMVQPGATAKVSKAYVLTSQSPVDIEVSEFLGNGTIVKQTFNVNQ